jgi:hypothetical protein
MTAKASRTSRDAVSWKAWGIAAVFAAIFVTGSLFPERANAQPNEARRAAQAARGLVIAGQCDAAIPSLERAIQLNPGQPELVRDRGVCTERLGRRQAAVADYRAYCNAAPNAADVPQVQKHIAELEAAPVGQPPPTAAEATTGDYVPPVVPPNADAVAVTPAQPVVLSERERRRREKERDKYYSYEDPRAPNALFLEGLGAGLFYSVNYERILFDAVSARVGFGFMHLGAAGLSANYFFVPITASYIGVHSGRSALELGAGVTVAAVTGSASGIGLSASGSGAVPLGQVLAGYRYHPLGDAGFQFRVGIEAIFGEGVGFSGSTGTSIGVLPWPYLSLGAGF